MYQNPDFGSWRIDTGLPGALLCFSGLRSRLCVAHVCRANAQQPKLFVGMILILIFAEALALYGLIGMLLASPSLKLGLQECRCVWQRSAVVAALSKLRLH